MNDDGGNPQYDSESWRNMGGGGGDNELAEWCSSSNEKNLPSKVRKQLDFLKGKHALSSQGSEFDLNFGDKLSYGQPSQDREVREKPSDQKKKQNAKIEEWLMGTDQYINLEEAKGTLGLNGNVHVPNIVRKK